MNKSLIALFAVTSAVKLNTEFRERNEWEQYWLEGWEFDFGKLQGRRDPESFILDLCNPRAPWGADDPEGCEEFLNEKWVEFIDKRKCRKGHLHWLTTGTSHYDKYDEVEACFEE